MGKTVTVVVHFEHTRTYRVELTDPALTPDELVKRLNDGSLVMVYYHAEDGEEIINQLNSEGGLLPPPTCIVEELATRIEVGTFKHDPDEDEEGEGEWELTDEGEGDDD